MAGLIFGGLVIFGALALLARLFGGRPDHEEALRRAADPLEGYAHLPTSTVDLHGTAKRDPAFEAEVEAFRQQTPGGAG